ncbi:hypothetical protein C7T94_11815 [Pedobacter yulinensis]|uniref:DUF306 domain-containing protein n=1 Tax=Pedobacter yulinensis TaxID=2126353 RepID=A0A2T3HLF7_9SPHI|nr:META domain-containing protein [Pedobacter yulinensis]PST83270.1 hypothetical protein C7T94_11815 [Pedobacter yulinensis]
MNICKSVVCLTMISALVCCKPNAEKTLFSKPEDLHGQWKLTCIHRGTSIIHSAFGEKKPVITIDYKKRQIQGFSGCNYFSGPFQAKNNGIKIGPLAATQIGCVPNGESIFFRQLAKANRFEVSKDSLKFLASDTVLLSFIKDRFKQVRY